MSEPPALQTSQELAPEDSTTSTSPPSTRLNWRARSTSELLRSAKGEEELPGNSTLSGGHNGISQTEFFKTLNRIIEALGALNGFSAAAISSLERGMLVERSVEENLKLKAAVTAGAELIRIQRNMLQRLGQRDNVEEVVLSLEHHYLLLRPSIRHPHLLISVILDRSRANLAVARFTLDEATAWLEA